MATSRRAASLRLILSRPVLPTNRATSNLLRSTCRRDTSSQSTPRGGTSGLETRKTRVGYQPSPSPPALPPKEQREFIALINKSNSSPAQQSHASNDNSSSTSQSHPDLRNLGPEEFSGDTNPKTGEVNGPKRDPLKWPNEWGYGGRATDF
ncbi:hypothetical protein PCANC_02990 [Puccinia coronata f. sp. avenae]|uniref:Succinate dehydrogenase assembly factor 4, mitochondrial n=1 Tax=Puccinia coronata f. sp. avenae TaxID=200324 RepID=A0A2N5UXE8_9BASI|nr:hypothetical protein PCASD_22518 [Puccinia coronata f. sp. avenae]PLW18582.1 hypothetical protein PCANC_09222 [Puccinia coronata f. sp. avenae]PLW42440.1 hypothetical protein PCASD_04669 [Puccinia coronata f. sp. avenae]PLW55931.1 hypothetical protein PCANC_02990 [Puccinia coronata f. sp. avenae]